MQLWTIVKHVGQAVLAVVCAFSALVVGGAAPARAQFGGPPGAVHRTYLPVLLRGYLPPQPLQVDLTVTNALNVARSAEPVTSGVPIPHSIGLTDLSILRLLDSAGRPVPAQFTPLARWGGAPNQAGKPVRWLLLDFQADVPASGNATYRLVSSGGAPPSFPTLTVSQNASAVTVNTGVVTFQISKTDGSLSAPRLAAPITGRATGSDGTAYSGAGPVTVLVVPSGPMRASVQVKGAYKSSGGRTLLNYTSRYWFYAGQPSVRLFHTVENNTPATLGEFEQPQMYDIGCPGSVTLRDVSLWLRTNLGGELTYQAGGAGTPVSGQLSADLLLYQDSSGTDFWNRYPILTGWEGQHVDARPRMQAYVGFRGYRTTLGGTAVDSGNQAAGWLSLAGRDGTWTAGVRDFWQNFPKALRATRDGTLQVGLFPDEFGPTGYSFTLRPGEHKTHEVVLCASNLSATRLLSPLFAQAPARWYADSGALGLLTSDRIAWPEYEQYVDHQLVTSPERGDAWEHLYANLPAAIEGSDFYGIFDYGDWPIDYEGLRVAPLNSKYDWDLGMWLQWARSGNVRWFELALAADRHLADVDILHNLHAPRHWADGIAFGHSTHDEDGFTNPHRNASGNHPDVAFGVPGLLACYYLTGYEKAYESALELADCIEYRLHNDAQLCGQFPAGTCNGAGYAIGASLSDVDARPAANALNIAVAAYRATSDARYLTVADALVDWARPSLQPFIHGPNGQEQVMGPWRLNMYLRSLSDYVEMRREFGLPDTYDARGTYLALADWLRTYAWIDLAPIAGGPRAAYPYEWWFDGRTGIPGEDNDNGDASVNNWLLLGADAMAYAYTLSGNANYLEWASRLFRTGSHDPWFEGDPSMYSETKQTANGVRYGNVFLYQWARR